MPRDIENEKKWRESRYYPKIGVTIKKEESALYEALQAAIQAHNMTIQEYLIEAARKQLKHEGYL